MPSVVFSIHAPADDRVRISAQALCLSGFIVILKLSFHEKRDKHRRKGKYQDCINDQYKGFGVRQRMKSLPS